MNALTKYKNKKVLVTGHTGFKGAWLSLWLHKLGAEVSGISLGLNPNDLIYRNIKNIFENDIFCDINNFNELERSFNRIKPDFVFHLAAQPLVRPSYNAPLETFNTNIIGTANILECIRQYNSKISGVIITTDKCYKNTGQKTPYKEDDTLGGDDPYSCSKACAELIINSYRVSFFKKEKLVASARAGNILGGGDFAEDRLVPDCIKALNSNQTILIRNPHHVRPWQYVLDALYGYLLLGERLLSGEEEYAQAWNFGPDSSSIVEVKKIVDILIDNWGSGKWVVAQRDDKKKESIFLILDNTKAKQLLNWKPTTNVEKTLKKAIYWYKNYNTIGVSSLCELEIDEYEKNQ